jgi:hypothetical protein
MPRTSTRGPPAGLPQPRRREAGRRVCVKTRFECHSEEVAAATDEESCTGLKILRARFLSRDCGIGMTPRRRFSHRLRRPSVGVGPKALGLPSEAFAQAGRRANSTTSMLPGFDFSVAPRLPLLGHGHNIGYHGIGLQARRSHPAGKTMRQCWRPPQAAWEGDNRGQTRHPATV